MFTGVFSQHTSDGSTSKGGICVPGNEDEDCAWCVEPGIVWSCATWPTKSTSSLCVLRNGITGWLQSISRKVAGCLFRLKCQEREPHMIQHTHTDHQSYTDTSAHCFMSHNVVTHGMSDLIVWSGWARWLLLRCLSPLLPPKTERSRQRKEEWTWMIIIQSPESHPLSAVNLPFFQGTTIFIHLPMITFSFSCLTRLASYSSFFSHLPAVTVVFLNWNILNLTLYFHVEVCNFSLFTKSFFQWFDYIHEL